jgi:hypothetical protein
MWWAVTAASQTFSNRMKPLKAVGPPQNSQMSKGPWYVQSSPGGSGNWCLRETPAAAAAAALAVVAAGAGKSGGGGVGHLLGTLWNPCMSLDSLDISGFGSLDSRTKEDHLHGPCSIPVNMFLGANRFGII